ncbi:MAG: hypothetical protein COT38_01465 [Candidatus Omnitrophica bacterium CG08_land_8_20_14_0_20_41_16]|uniref:FixG C-terminal immunoglobulin-like domain-containing protein n=1 Tax=Candidatus Sherwoodlollariibacterium unditelluris TaxID=1974757 RepID=A0A2G9YIX3_9BACT|nr:MAG: hypothetical protein COX41_04075 [Candidatus Omnitrophica bacterium CG23_combo_of_CG06-09_8_20_14_all_41_10]PIS34167.1 MAG: hypothetical protein COT38_01465 [Candidatus Omnitrophica bacterium CG08_land_8_20_14_0_20_41_16]
MSGLREKIIKAVKGKGVPFQDVPLLIILVVVFCTKLVFGAGLEVGPGDIYVDNVSLGKTAAVSTSSREKVKLNIKNKGASACTYSIDILRSAQTTAALGAGYLDIPDVAWIFPETKEILVPPNSAKDVELYIKIPKKKEFYNKKYQAVIEVKSKKNKPEEIFVLACQLKILFSTSAPAKGKRLF